MNRFLAVSSSTLRQTSRASLFVVLAVSFCCVLAKVAAQNADARILTPNAPIERELSGGQTHIYRIALGAGQFALVQVEQRGAELMLMANGPDGKEFAGVDLRVGGEGVEPLGILADIGGEYLLKVISRNPKGASGRYEVRISALRVATELDRVYMKAQTLCHEAQPLSLEKTPEAKRKAVRLYEEALPLWRQVPEPFWEAGLLRRLGRLHIDLTEFREAKDYFIRAVAAMKAAGDRRGEVTAQNGVCEALSYLGEAREKADCIDGLIAIYRGLGARQEEGRALANKALALKDLGDYQAGLQTMQEALPILQAQGDPVLESFALYAMGQIYHSLSENQLALDYFERALALRRDGGDRRRLGLTIGEIAGVYYDLGDFPRAIDHFNQALAIAEEVGDRQAKAAVLQSLGLIWERTGETAKALDAQTQALALARAVGDRGVECRTLIPISDLYLSLGEKEKARDSLSQALEIARAIGDPVAESAAIRKMGKTAAAGGDSQEAINLFQKSLSLARAIKDLNDERDALVILAQTERDRNNLSEAREYHQQALELNESLRARVLRQELRATFLASRQDEYESYIDLLMQSHQRQPTAGYAAYAFEISERSRARSLIETLTEARANIRQGVDAGLLSEERKLGDSIRIKEQQRARLIGNSQAGKQASALEKEIGDLLSQYQSLQARIREASPRYWALTQPQPATAAEIQSRSLDSRTVLLEFALGEKRSWMWAVTPDEIASFELPPRNEIETAARKFYGILTARQPRNRESSIQYAARVAEADAEFQAEASALSRLLLSPVASKLNLEWKGKRLVIVGSGALDYLPFATLPAPPVPEAGAKAPVGYHPLIADHEVVNLPSASALAAIRRESGGQRKAAGTLAILADPVFDTNDPRVAMAARKRETGGNLVVNLRSAGTSSSAPASNPELMRSVRSINREGFSRLLSSGEEADAIAALIPRTRLLKATGFKANRAKATSGELARYRIVHFATHGLLNSERPELSGLVLSLVDDKGEAQDGFLRMRDIYNLQLPADVVVLSACQTALGKEIRGEGLVGLTRGFMYAGARRVVASLWQVDDMATEELMKRFYRGMLINKMRPAAALRAAQIEMMKQKRWAAPYFWAAFTTQGEWR